MTDEEILDLAETYGWMDDFGRWNFQGDHRLLDFATKLIEAEREACAKVADAFDPEQRLSNYGQVIANNIRTRGEVIGLTDEEVLGLTCECVDDGTFNMRCAHDFARAIEAKIKEKNA